jgi:DNA-binding NarL/FixJ family response regulator
MSQAISILLIEDNPNDIELFDEVLKDIENETISLTSATRLSDGILQLQKKVFEIVFLDLSLPDANGLDGFTKLHNQAPTVPIVILTGFNDNETALEIVRQGAQDYLIKGEIEPHLLIKSIRYAIERKRAQKIIQEAERFKVLAQTAVTTAHLINQPLTSIIGFIDLIKATKPDPKKLDNHLNAIREAGIKIHEIVKKMETIERHVATPYLDEVEMIDLDAATKKIEKPNH